ncbi:uncharacterized protein LOC127856912 isoform X2 [Dreissena polymorpha]|uniref:Uncharacterized protein n=1 Tax=Dreissena polymorpha TaxID=45954 RepID=A0A9D4BUV7_DREPO|nr:uncharacterized protein LOC127856912 isoform X2 [Dreissena polymorpha]KAH3709894.1 hypothetical protein DPMN_069359 [Dreissena polymorpha]
MICSRTSFAVALLTHFANDSSIQKLATALKKLLEYNKTYDKTDRQLTDGMAQHMCLDIATTLSSIYTRAGKSLNESIFAPIFACYQAALCIDVTSCRLKMASMLNSRGNMQAAMVLLEDVERLYTHRIVDVCQCPECPECDYIQTKTATPGKYSSSLCVIFSKEDVFCMPPFIVKEYCTAMFENNDTDKYVDKRNRESYAFGARPLLYYLQYLTYGALKLRNKQKAALTNLVQTLDFDEMDYYSDGDVVFGDEDSDDSDEEEYGESYEDEADDFGDDVDYDGDNDSISNVDTCDEFDYGQDDYYSDDTYDESNGEGYDVFRDDYAYDGDNESSSNEDEFQREYIVHHSDKAINLLGHCFEMEGNVESAMHAYCCSYNKYPEHIGARVHIRRLIHAELLGVVHRYDPGHDFS